MKDIDWYTGLNVSITVSDNEGRILFMNDKSADTFSKSGGRSLVGTNLMNCHKPESWEKIISMLKEGRTNSYTIEKNGIKKLIYQTPWYTDGKISGLVEFSLEIPFEMEHYIRK